MIWFLTRITGLSEFMAPWGMRLILFRRILRISSQETRARSAPSSRMRPLTMRPGGLIMRIRLRAMVDLPHPDSPTRPSFSLGARPRVTPSTALTAPARVG